jgi:hypothetical protein
MYSIFKKLKFNLPKKIKFNLIVTGIFVTCTSTSFAQFPNLKGLLDKAKEKIDSSVINQSSVEPQRPTVAPTITIPPSTSVKTLEKRQEILKTNDDGTVTISKEVFKRQWCNSVESDTLGPFDYKGVRPGDICGQPDAFLDLIFPEGSTSLNPKGIVMADLDSDIVRSKGFELTNV